MKIRIIEETTGDVLTPEDVRAMRLPFKFGWEAWGVFDELDQLVGKFDSYRKALLFKKCGLQTPTALAA